MVISTLSAAAESDPEVRVAHLLGQMTVAEKIGQMAQLNGAAGTVPEGLREAIRAGRVGAILNEVDVEVVNELQRVAVEESRLGIPLLVGRDVIHGFRTVLPIPLGLAATFNPELVREGARLAALEARTAGVNWTFAPMIDVTRDPRWGRVAEGLGEDPYLASVLGAAMVVGFQGDDLSQPGAIAACAKHFAGYGAVEAGRDYATTSIPEGELRDVHLPPFRAAVDAGVATVMTSFTDLNGVPASGSEFLLSQVLRDEWGFDGFVVSDWGSIGQMTTQGFTADDREAARAAFEAGVNMEMATPLYAGHLQPLLDNGRIDAARLDALVADILRVKFRLGLFESPYTDPADFPPTAGARVLAVARASALQSLVLLENRDGTLPLDRARLRRLAVIGPLADAPYEQLGTWVFDGDPSLSRTPLLAIRELLGDAAEVRHVKALDHTRDRSTAAFGDAVAAAESADVAVLFLGEESILSGEAHSRADIDLPGGQAELVRALARTGTPLVAVVMAGRPLTLAPVLDDLDALLYAWHPGTMAGPAIADVLFGLASPSGKLPVTFPRMVGQVPIYYAHRRTGRPADPGSFMRIDDIPVRMPQTSSGFVSGHLDAGFEPLYPFGHGLSYGRFVYGDIGVEPSSVAVDGRLTVGAVVRNDGPLEAEEVVQLYVQDVAAQVTRPVRELKGFRRVRLAPGESRAVSFELRARDLAFHGRDMRPVVEPGEFRVWVGGSSAAELTAGFRIAEGPTGHPDGIE